MPSVPPLGSIGTVTLKIPVTPPGTMGTTRGGHIYVELPDLSGSPTARADGTTIADGSFLAQGDWSPIDCGRQPYLSTEQAWTVTATPNTQTRLVYTGRVYVSPYSDDIDTPLVRYGLPGATPSATFTVPAQVVTKPNSGSNVTTALVTGISASVASAVSISGKLRRPISITADLSGLPADLPNGWGYQLVGYKDGDLTQDPVLATGIILDTAGGLVPAGPDGIATPHTFGPEEPTGIMSITVYARAGIVSTGRKTVGSPAHSAGDWDPNNIIPGITASCTISIGTTGGVVDMSAVWLASTSAEFHIDPSTGVFAMDKIDFTKAKPGTFSSEFTSGSGAPLTMAIVDLFKASNFNTTEFVKSGGILTFGALAADKIKSGILEVGGADTGGNRVSRFKVFDTATPTANLIGWIGDDSAGSGFVGAWFKRILIGGTSPATAKIVADSAGDVAISGTLIAGNIAGNAANITGSLAASQIAAGTISAAISMTSPSLSITGSGWSILLNSSNGLFMQKGSISLALSGATTTLLTMYNSTSNQVTYMGVNDTLLIDQNTGVATRLFNTGFSTYGGSVPFTGTLANAIALGKNVVAGIIVV